MKASSRTLPSELNASRSLSVSEANYTRCIALLGEQAIVELISAVGFYVMGGLRVVESNGWLLIILWSSCLSLEAKTVFLN